MHCPKCRVEYRPGFATCSDCGVPLVPEVYSSAFTRPEPGDPDLDPYCAFWKGTDARLLAELCTVLDEAGIPHKTVHRQDHLFNFNNQTPYQIGVPASFYEKAELVVKEAFSSEEEGADSILNPTEENSPNFRALSNLAFNEKWRGRSEEEQPTLLESLTWRNPGQEENTESGIQIPVESTDGDWFPEDATSQVWSGDIAQLKEMIEMSLHENDIRMRWEVANDRPQLFVLPDDEPRAREIIREILEASPPE